MNAKIKKSQLQFSDPVLKEFHLEKEEDFSIPKKLKINNKEFER